MHGTTDIVAPGVIRLGVWRGAEMIPADLLRGFGAERASGNAEFVDDALDAVDGGCYLPGAVS